MERGIVLTFWPVTVSMTKAGFPYFGSRPTNELDHNFKSPIPIDFFRNVKVDSKGTCHLLQNVLPSWVL